ncbi:MAG: M14 family zinc carboxypeptidase [Candidatus Jorgensenbacteria bacterium]|nr:M14 family zinc carboxypeptidase [Candidatus Jorgensenbacteria bacterium]
MKNIIIVFLVVVIIGAGAYFVIRGSFNTADVGKVQDANISGSVTQSQDDAQTGETSVTNKGESVIGKSVESRDITAYHYGTGDAEILFVGGIHGGYEWNTALVAYEAMDYLKANPTIIPANVRATVIPVLNPDGLYKVIGTTGRFTASQVSSSQAIQTSGRFNANNVDLNRNFDCDWQESAKWQNTKVSGGSSVFSEPESLAIKNYIETQKPKAVVVWYSAANGVFASNCHNGVLPETNTITKKFADASGYPAYESFNFYEITGDMVNWLAKSNIPAISVLLKNHTDTEWSKNQAGIEALLKYYAK